MNKFVEKHPGLIIIIVGGLGILGCIAGFSYFFQSEQSFGFTSNTSGVASSTLNTISNPVSNGLIGWWTFDGPTMNVSSTASSTMLDLSGNGNTMTAQTTTAGQVVTAGKIGQGGLFAGTNRWNTINPMASSSVLLPTSTNVSVSLWAKFVGTSVTGMMYRCSGNFGYRMRNLVTTGIVNFSFFSADSALHSVNTAAAMNDGRWHHYVGTYDHATVSLYVDNVLTSTVAATDDIFYQTNVCSIGHNGGELNTFLYTGALDDVKVYNRAITASEVTSLYNNGK